jgi:hypothetical protein
MAGTPSPVPTAPPSTYGLTSYAPMSSQTNTMAAGYQAPMSNINSGQLNSIGQSYYAGNGPQTVAKTNYSTGAIVPTPQPGPAPQVLGSQDQGGTQGTVDYNSMIQPALDALNGVANSAQSSYDANVSNINTNQSTQQGILNQNLTTQQGDVNAAKNTQKSLTQNAVQQAKQAYSEIAQGLQSRFGGSTGTGAFANEIAGRQTTTNMAAFQTNLANAMQQLDTTWTQVQQNHDNNMKSLNDQTQSAIAQAKSTLDSNMANIGTQRGALQSQKAEMINNAIQNYQQTVSAVNTAQTQFAQTLAANLASAGQSVQQAISTAQAIVGSGRTGANQATQGTQNIAQGFNGATTPVNSAQAMASGLPVGYWGNQYGQVQQKQFGT